MTDLQREWISLLNQINNSSLKPLQSQVDNIKKKLQNKEIALQQGITLLDVKIQTLIKYLIHLACYIHAKVNGQSIQHLPSIEKLIESRVVLEKIKPIETKIRYQIEKLVKKAIMSRIDKDCDDEVEKLQTDGHDPLDFKPNPENLLMGSIAEAQSDEEKGGKRLYKAPRVAPMHYEEDIGSVSKQRKKEKELEKLERKSRILRDLRSEYDVRPEEIGADGGVKASDTSEAHRVYESRRNYEEDNFIRLPETKEEKKWRKQANRKGMIQGLQNDFKSFGDFSSVLDAASEQAGKSVVWKNSKHGFNDDSGDDLVVSFSSKPVKGKRKTQFSRDMKSSKRKK